MNLKRCQRTFGPSVLILLAMFALWATNTAFADLPRVSIGTVNGKKQFKTSAGAFVPRGANYVRLSSNGLHDTFTPGKYNESAVEAMLDQLQFDGYNLVRVFIDPGSNRGPNEAGGVGRAVGSGDSLDAFHLSNKYMGNVVKFIRAAAERDIYVMPVLHHIPLTDNPHYSSIVETMIMDPRFGGAQDSNALYMDEGHVEAKIEYAKNFVDDLRDRLSNSLMKTIFAYAIENEAHFRVDLFPFASAHTGETIATADGLTYDMSDTEERQQAADANAVHWANEVRSAIKSSDSQALVTTGLFTFRSVGLPNGPDGLMDTVSDKRRPARADALSIHSNLDFLDLHTYPVGGNYTLAADLDSVLFEHVNDVVMLGEFGAFKSQYNNNITNAAFAMRDLQIESCAFDITGWLFWTYDTDDTQEQRRLYTLIQNNGAINGQLAPIVRADPCTE